MRGILGRMSLFATLLLVCCTVSVFAQESLGHMPDAVRQVVAGGVEAVPDVIKNVIVGRNVGGQEEVPRAISNIVTSTGTNSFAATGTPAVVKKIRAPYVCKNTPPIQGTELFSVPSVGSIHARSVSIVRGATVGKYWKEYSATVDREIATEGLYVAAVKYLNPQIRNLDEICRGSTIRLPHVSTREQTLPLPPIVIAKDSRDEEIIALRERAAWLEGRVQAQENRITRNEALIAEVRRSLSVIPVLRNEINTLREAVENKDVIIVRAEAPRSELTVDERQAALRETTIVLVLTAIAVLVCIFLFMVVRAGRSRRVVSKSVPEESHGHEEKTVGATEENVVSLGTMPFLYHGNLVILEVVEVQTPCSEYVLLENFGTHRRKCSQKVCAKIVPCTLSQLPLGHMLYTHTNGTGEAVRVITAKAPCGVTGKLRNMQKHIDDCVFPKCTKVQAETTALVGAQA